MSLHRFSAWRRNTHSQNFVSQKITSGQLRRQRESWMQKTAHGASAGGREAPAVSRGANPPTPSESPHPCQRQTLDEGVRAESRSPLWSGCRAPGLSPYQASAHCRAGGRSLLSPGRGGRDHRRGLPGRKDPDPLEAPIEPLPSFILPNPGVPCQWAPAQRRHPLPLGFGPQCLPTKWIFA